MNHYLDANKHSWAALPREHYETYKARLSAYASTLSRTHIQELEDIEGKTLIHLQCNTGVDTIPSPDGCQGDRGGSRTGKRPLCP